jgi:hypothetical protein
MPLKLDKTLRREILLDGHPYTVAIGPDGVRITAKGFRKGRGLSWQAVLALGLEEEARHGLRDQTPADVVPQRNSRSDRQ